MQKSRNYQMMTSIKYQVDVVMMAKTIQNANGILTARSMIGSMETEDGRVNTVESIWAEKRDYESHLI